MTDSTVTPNNQLRSARMAMLSPSGSRRPMSRQELADACNAELDRRYEAQRRRPRWAGMTEKTIGTLERGEIRWPNEDYRRALCVVLKSDERSLGLYIDRPVPDREDQLPVGQHDPIDILTGDGRSENGTSCEVDSSLWMAPDTAELISLFTRRDLVKRRDATRTFAGLAVGSALIGPLHRWLLSGHCPRPHHRRRAAFGVQEVEEIEKTARMFRSWDDRIGGGLRRKAVVGQLSEVADMLDGAPMTPLTKRLYAAMAQLAGTAATASWDSGQQGLAQRYYLLGLRAARDGDDYVFAANLLAGLARQFLYLGRASDALELVRLAQTCSSGRASHRVQAMLLTREAWAHASMGDITAFRRTTSRAEDVLASAMPDDDDPYWIDYFDPAELAGVTGGRLLELAHRQPILAGESAEHIDRAIAMRRDVRLRSRALDRIGVAEARLIEGEMEEACRLGHAAAEVAEQTPSDRVRVKLREFATCIDGAQGPGLGELRGRLRVILGSATAS
jgi:hypothetical protein